MSKNIISITLEFTSDTTALNLTEAPFNKTQKITRLKNGHYLLTVNIEDSLLLTGWINTWKEKAGILRIEKSPVK